MNAGEWVAISILIFTIAICVLAMGLSLFELYKDRVYHKKYQNVFDLIKEKNAIDTCGFHNDKIWPLERKIDTLEDNKKYMPKGKTLEIEKEEEEIKKQIQGLKVIHNEMLRKSEGYTKRIRKATLDTKDARFIKYMKNLGWFREE